MNGTRHRGRPTLAPTARAILCGLAVVACAWSPLGRAQEEGFGVHRVGALEGYVAALYDGSWVVGSDVAYGGAGGAPVGASISAGVELEVGDAHVSLDATDLAPRQQNVEFAVDAPHAATRVSWSNVPPVGEGDVRRTELRLRQRLRLDGRPRARIQASRRTRGDRPARADLGVTLSDGYRDVAPGVTRLRWRAGYRVGTAPYGSDAARTTHRLRVGLGTEVDARDDGVRVRPEGTVELRWDETDASRFRHGYDLSLGARSADGRESLEVSVARRFDSERAPRASFGVDYVDARLERVAIEAGVTTDRRDGGWDADYRLGAAYDVTDAVGIHGGYHARRQDERSSHGAEASLRLRLGRDALRFSGRSSVDVQVYPDGRVAPEARGSVSARYDGGVWAASVRSSLRYAEARTRGRLEVSADLDRDPLQASLAAGLRASREWAAHASLDARTRLYGAWSLQGRGRYRATFDADADRVVTVGVGLRYDFGGTR